MSEPKPRKPRAPLDRLSLVEISKRRRAEDARLRRMLDQVRAERDALDAREAEIMALLNLDIAPVSNKPAAPTNGGALRNKCADCGVMVPAAPGDDECPACHAGPFEAAL